MEIIFPFTLSLSLSSDWMIELWRNYWMNDWMQSFLSIAYLSKAPYACNLAIPLFYFSNDKMLKLRYGVSIPCTYFMPSNALPSDLHPFYCNTLFVTAMPECILLWKSAWFMHQLGYSVVHEMAVSMLLYEIDRQPAITGNMLTTWWMKWSYFWSRISE